MLNHFDDVSLNERRARAARNQALFREVNERIDELGVLWPGDNTGHYVCECLDPACAEVIRGLSPEDYQQVRCDPTEFVVLPGHERLDVEDVVDRTPRWLVVRKIGAGTAIAERLAAEGRRAREKHHVG